uniref:Uncharacterized protein n=1 Tax=Avena sativa TaxID=4498 RepID=A0ACD5U0G7_AVESA
MGSTRRSASNGSKGGAPSVWVFLAVLLLILMLSSSPCQGRKLPAADHDEQGKVIHFEGGLVLRVSSSSGSEEAATAAAAAPRGFSRAERSMRSVPSPGVGH